MDKKGASEAEGIQAVVRRQKEGARVPVNFSYSKEREKREGANLRALGGRTHKRKDYSYKKETPLTAGEKSYLESAKLKGNWSSVGLGTPPLF